MTSSAWRVDCVCSHLLLGDVEDVGQLQASGRQELGGVAAELGLEQKLVRRRNDLALAHAQHRRREQ